MTVPMLSPDLQALLHQAAALRESGRVHEAIAAYRTLLGQEPRLPDSWYNLARMLRQAGDPQGALGAYEEALRNDVTQPEEIFLNCGVILAEDLGDPERAKAAYKQAIEINPRMLGAWFNLGNVCEDLGEREEAANAYQQILLIAPGETEPLARLGGLAIPRSANEDIIVRIEAERSRPDLSSLHRASLEFALGKLLDQVGEYDRAFEAYKTANVASAAGRARTTPHYNRVAQDGFIGLFEALPPALPFAFPPSAVTPVFILGQFRSGSTLLEQILSAHSGITPAGELPILHAFATQSLLPYPQAIAPLTRETIAPYREKYLELLAHRMPQARGLITDKRPDNFYHVGLIQRMFPEAKILHTVRDARDVCLSTWFTHLDHSQSHALSLEDTGHHYASYERLMQHWKKQPGLQMLDVQYEKLVTSPEAEIRRVLEFLGLPFEAGTLEFYNSPNAVRTASVWQVREPLYERSIGRWRHYEKHLGPLMQTLGPRGA